MAFAVSRRRSPRVALEVAGRLFSRFRRLLPGGEGKRFPGASRRRVGLALAGLTACLAAAFLALRPAPGPAPLAAVPPPARSGIVANAGPASPEAPLSAKAATAAASGNGAVGNAVRNTDQFQTFTVRPGDTLSALFERAGLDKSEYLRVMALGTVVSPLRVLHPGDRIRLRTAGTQDLAELRYTEGPLHSLEITAGPGGLQAHQQNLQPATERTSVSDVVTENLSVALRRVGLSASKVAEFVKIFHWRVDFRRDIRRGTRFSVVYDRRHAGNRELSPGPIVAAELVLPGRTLRAFRFSSSGGDAGYYDDRGASMRPTLLRTPVHYTRVSSRFSRRRFNPVLHIWRPHWGVDLAAHIGTPVMAAGDGRITFMGRDGGYGNLVKIKNFGPYSTRYAHLRRFARGLHAGSHVRQGEIIGYVGESGEATGPHLHFEIRVHGVPHNPLRVKLPAGAPLAPRERRRFKSAIRPLLTMLEHSEGDQQLAYNEGASADLGRP